MIFPSVSLVHNFPRWYFNERPAPSPGDCDPPTEELKCWCLHQQGGEQWEQSTTIFSSGRKDVSVCPIQWSTQFLLSTSFFIGIGRRYQKTHTWEYLYRYMLVWTDLFPRGTLATFAWCQMAGSEQCSHDANISKTCNPTRVTLLPSRDLFVTLTLGIFVIFVVTGLRLMAGWHLANGSNERRNHPEEDGDSLWIWIGRRGHWARRAVRVFVHPRGRRMFNSYAYKALQGFKA